jgi:hypothetical protein
MKAVFDGEDVTAVSSSENTILLVERYCRNSTKGKI